MARPKKINTNETQTAELVEAQMEPTTTTEPQIKVVYGEQLVNDNNNANYWRSQIPKEFIVPNVDWFKKRQKNVPDSTEGLEDYQLIIKLGGLRAVANKFGYRRVNHDVIHASKDYVAVKTTIEWNNNVEFTSLACAHIANTKSFTKNYLMEMAENRGFCRAVRNYLNINVVSSDELGDDNYEGDDTSVTVTQKLDPHGILNNKLAERNISFEKLITSLTKIGFEVSETWKAVEDIPTDKIFSILTKISKKQEQ